MTGSDQPDLIGVHDGLDPVTQAKLGQHPSHMGFDRRFGEKKLGGDLGVGEPSGYFDQDLPLSVGK
jgi:hypothetical protein